MRANSGLEGKVAVVTGGGSGIGAAICQHLSNAGARVVALDIDESAARATAERCGGTFSVVDVRDSQTLERTASEVADKFGALDVYVNCAGASDAAHVSLVANRMAAQRRAEEQGQPIPPLNALLEIGDEQWSETLRIHLDGTFYGTRSAVRIMTEQRRGAIVNMSSVCGIEGCVGHPHYSAAKAAVIGFSRAVAKEVITLGIRVNVVAPGYIASETAPSDLARYRSTTIDRIPARRLGTPDEVAATVEFLAGAQGEYFVGATLSPNGGLVTAG